MNVPPPILASLKASYGPLDDPDYAFVSRALESQPYAGIIAGIASLVGVEETTDTNDDVSFRYVLRHGSKVWALNLSMVGPYGLMMRIAPGSPPQIVTGETPGADPEEDRLRAALEGAGIALLPRTTLEGEVSLARPGEEGEVTRVYHALIGDDSTLPWDFSTDG